MKKNAFLCGFTAVALMLAGCGGGDKKTTGGTGSLGAAGKTKPSGGDNKAGAAAKDFPKDKATASVSGTIKLEGKAPKVTEIDISVNADCKKLHGDKKLMTEGALVGSAGELANAVVYIQDLEKEYRFETPTEKKTIDQSLCHYIPHVFGIMVDQELIVKNSDPTNHNINALPFFNETQPTQGEKIKKFDSAKMPMPIKCDVHPWMRAYACIFEHPFYAVSGPDGKYALPEKLPPGKYTLAVWHENEDYEAQAQELELKDGETKTADFTFKLK